MSERQKKPWPSSEWAFFGSALFAFLTVAGPTFWFAQSSWRHSGLLWVVWPIVSTLAWLYVLDGYEGEWSWDDE